MTIGRAHGRGRRGLAGALGPRAGELGRRRALWVAALLMAGASATAQPVLHEYIELGPGDGPVEPAVTGQLGARPRGPSGVAATSTGGEDIDPSAPPGVAGANAGSMFSIDRDTSRPERVSYADPFTPTVVPFKRSMVYDAVDAQGDLLVRDRELADVPVVAGPRPNDETFHAVFELSLTANQPVPIPSVAPGARLVVVNREPRVPLRIGADSAENWSVTSPVSRSVRLTLELVADRRVFGSAYPDVSAASLASALSPLPSEVKASALEVARTLGIDARARPQQMVAALVEHFRRFSASERHPTSQGLALYRELALTARGICRHRAYAFMLTALGLGVPARVALNEAHAWVEVYDGELWHRIDLGGAASELEMAEPGRPRHVEPRDPFAWPDRSESGLAMAERRATARDDASAGGGEGPAAPPADENEGAQPTPPDGVGSNDPALGAPPPAQPPAPDTLPSATPPEAPADPGEVRLRAAASRAERGKSLSVSGSVHSGGSTCSGARVDVSLAPASGAPVPLGTLITNARGEFRGSLVIPWNAALGEHTVVASASGCNVRPAIR